MSIQTTEREAQELARMMGRPWEDMGGYEREQFRDEVRREADRDAEITELKSTLLFVKWMVGLNLALSVTILLAAAGLFG